MSGLLTTMRRIETLPPPGVHNLEAQHTIAFVFCLLGMVPATLYTASVHWSPGNITSHADLTNDGSFLYPSATTRTVVVGMRLGYHMCCSNLSRQVHAGCDASLPRTLLSSGQHSVFHCGPGPLLNAVPFG